MFLKIMLFGLLIFSLASAETKKAPQKKPAKPTKKVAKKVLQKSAPAEHEENKKAVIVTDAWYVVQAGSSPWGFYHETIEQRDDRYAYRYEMTKRERGHDYQEFIGALAKLDLTPITFNLNKTGKAATEVINGNYVANPQRPGDGRMHIEIQGARQGKLKRSIAKGTILESFLSLWIKKNWDELKPGTKHKVRLFSEDPDGTNFSGKNAKLVVQKFDTAKNCQNIRILFKDETYDWCIRDNGLVIDMVVGLGKIHVRKVTDEAEARAFLK